MASLWCPWSKNAITPGCWTTTTWWIYVSSVGKAGFAVQICFFVFWVKKNTLSSLKCKKIQILSECKYHWNIKSTYFDLLQQHLDVSLVPLHKMNHHNELARRNEMKREKLTNHYNIKAMYFELQQLQ